MEERKMKPRPRKSRRKVCGFCVDKVEHIDYKDTARLRKYVSEGFFDRHRRIWITEIIYNLFAIKTNDSPFTG